MHTLGVAAGFLLSEDLTSLFLKSFTEHIYQRQMAPSSSPQPIPKGTKDEGKHEKDVDKEGGGEERKAAVGGAPPAIFNFPSYFGQKPQKHNPYTVVEDMQQNIQLCTSPRDGWENYS